MLELRRGRAEQDVHFLSEDGNLFPEMSYGHNDESVTTGTIFSLLQCTFSEDVPLKSINFLRFGNSLLTKEFSTLQKLQLRRDKAEQDVRLLSEGDNPFFSKRHMRY